MQESKFAVPIPYQFAVVHLCRLIVVELQSIYWRARLVTNMQLMAMPRQEIYILESDEVNGNLTKLIDRNATSAKP
jgi:hypothetical protein